MLIFSVRYEHEIYLECFHTSHWIAVTFAGPRLSPAPPVPRLKLSVFLHDDAAADPTLHAATSHRYLIPTLPHRDRRHSESYDKSRPKSTSVQILDNSIIALLCHAPPCHIQQVLFELTHRTRAGVQFWLPVLLEHLFFLLSQMDLIRDSLCRAKQLPSALLQPQVKYHEFFCSTGIDQTLKFQKLAEI